jgi:hypothetical protein
MTPEEARARARKIFQAQAQGQVIKLDQGGNPVPVTEPAFYGKKTTLYDPKGEFARDLFNNFEWFDDFNFDQDSPEFRMGSVRDNAHRHEVEREKLASAWNAIEINPTWYGVITSIGGAAQSIPGGLIRDFQIVVSGGYPNAEPRAYPIGWTPTGQHVYKDGHLCLWRPNDWSPRYTLAYAVAKTYVWIHKHEEYVRSGWWPGNQQEH